MRDRSCAWTLSRLPLFAGGDHRARDDAEIRQHLKSCASCRLELGPYLRSRRALLRAAGEASVALDPARMHREILAAVEGLPAPAARAPAARRAGLLAAGLFCAGLVAVQWAGGRGGLGFFEREPLTPANASTSAADFGTRLRPLGLGADPADGSGVQGLMGRLRLRTLALETVLPELPPELRDLLEKPESETGK